MSPKTPARGPLMARRTPTSQEPAPPDSSTPRGPAPGPGAAAQTQSRATPIPGRALGHAVRHFIGHVKLAGWERLRTRCVQRLLRMKALDAARLLGQPVLLIDATGLLCFQRRHCEHCLVQQHGNKTLYLHHVLEAKLLGPAGV